ncbi:MAG TPA: peptidase M22 [Clostridia bacterium]|nr:peptidase M22 [Clostridia bacterium]
MGFYLGIDTSNYTTSAAVYDGETGAIYQQKKLLWVKKGEKGLKQSDAVFQHVRQLPEMIGKLMDGSGFAVKAVGASIRPRDAEGSYMPCFTVGECVARSVASAAGIAFYDFSHQAGHIVAALFSAGRLEMLKEKFIAFHVSGGTTEAVLYCPGNPLEFNISLIAKSLDLKAGQLIDRTGLLLGLDFPAGPALEKLALQSSREFKIKPCMKGPDCCLSGIENQCADMKRRGEPDEDIAKFCMDSVEAVIEAMTQGLLRDHPGSRLLYAGGVMSNRSIREKMTGKYGAVFAEPAFSSDNAAGIAVLTKLRADYS